MLPSPLFGSRGSWQTRAHATSAPQRIAILGTTAFAKLTAPAISGAAGADTGAPHTL